MGIVVERGTWEDIAPMRELYRHDSACQIRHDAALERGYAVPYIVTVDGNMAGYGGVFTDYYPGRVMEFYVTPDHRSRMWELFRIFLSVSEATTMEAQTNIPHMRQLLYDCTTNITTEKVLFEDATETELSVPAGRLRQATTEAERKRGVEPSTSTGTWLRPTNWVLDVDGHVVAGGGILTHYNPPYGDIHMHVDEGERCQGYGSYVSQELKRVGYERGVQPAARCDPDNVASRRTLEKAGFRVSGRMLVGEIDWSSSTYLGLTGDRCTAVQRGQPTPELLGIG